MIPPAFYLNTLMTLTWTDQPCICLPTHMKKKGNPHESSYIIILLLPMLLSELSAHAQYSLQSRACGGGSHSLSMLSFPSFL